VPESVTPPPDTSEKTWCLLIVIVMDGVGGLPSSPKV
jgi:hypothetical protein